MVNLNISSENQEPDTFFSFTIEYMFNLDVRLWKGTSFDLATYETAFLGKIYTGNYNEHFFVSFVAK
jgi:hypothetical protein